VHDVASFAPVTYKYGIVVSNGAGIYQVSNLVIDKGTTYNADNIGSWEATAIKDDPLYYNTSQLPTGFTGTFGVDMKPNIPLQRDPNQSIMI